MNEPLRQQIKRLADRIDQMSLRERGLIFLGVLATLYIVASSVVLSPLIRQARQQEQALIAKREQVARIEEQIQQTIEAHTRDVDAENQARIKVLRERLAQRDPALAGASRGLVQPTDMVELVEQMLLRNRALQVIRVENLPAEPLDTPAAGSKAGAPAASIYRHGMRIELRGRYVDIVNYLHELESLPWKMFWGKFTLVAEDYPNSRVTLVIYTLSLRPGWMGT